MDSRHRPIEDFGALGVDGGRGAKYFMIPPDYNEYVPASGYQVFEQETCFVWTMTRPIIKDKSAATLNKAIDLVQQVNVYPFAGADKPKPTPDRKKSE